MNGVGDRPVSKEETIAYKEALTGQYAPASVNSMLAALNYFLRFAGRSDCCVKMKALCKEAGVSSQKVYPHSLRHLFARIFYTLEKDIVRLADLLGHGSVDTTRIYTRETGNEHLRRLRKVEKLLMMT